MRAIFRLCDVFAHLNSTKQTVNRTPILLQTVFLVLVASGCGRGDVDVRPVAAPLESCAPLFDGASLNRWTMLGDAEMLVEDSVIVGRGVRSGRNSFLRTDDEYGDFDLNYDFRIDPGFNSGVQIRSHVASDTLRFQHQAGNGDRFEQVTLPGTVYGYQAEIDPSERGWTLEIYEESGRGWLQTFSKTPGQKLIEPGKWHHGRVRAVGDTIRTWLDGSPVATLVDTMSSRGFIALQVHTVYADEDIGKEVRFRDLVLCE